jgi:hypothetical protein
MIIQVLKFGGREPAMDTYVVPTTVRLPVMGVTRQGCMCTTLNSLRIFVLASDAYAKNGLRRRRVT